MYFIMQNSRSLKDTFDNLGQFYMNILNQIEICTALSINVRVYNSQLVLKNSGFNDAN